jgi:hypothetical protein
MTVPARKSFASLGPAVILASSAIAFAGEIAVVNPSFQTPDVNPCAFPGGSFAGWTGVGTFGVWNPGLGTTCAPLNGFPSGVPDGDQIGFVNTPNQPLKQVLTATLQPNAPYTLLVDVGRRSDGFAMVSYRIRLVSNGIILAEDFNGVSPPFGGFATSSLSFTASADHPALGFPLEIHLILVTGPQANFDNVRLSGPTGESGPPGDISGDGVINATDLALLLGAWGTCGQCDACPADINDDCEVNAADLATLLGAWTG